MFYFNAFAIEIRDMMTKKYFQILNMFLSFFMVCSTLMLSNEQYNTYFLFYLILVIPWAVFTISSELWKEKVNVRYCENISHVVSSLELSPEDEFKEWKKLQKHSNETKYGIAFFLITLVSLMSTTDAGKFEYIGLIIILSYLFYLHCTLMNHRIKEIQKKINQIRFNDVK